MSDLPEGRQSQPAEHARSPERSIELARASVFEPQTKPFTVAQQDSKPENRENGSSQVTLTPDGGYRVTYKLGSREDGLAQSEQRMMPDGTMRQELLFQGRRDGMLKQTTSTLRSGEDHTVSQFADGRRTETDRKFGQLLRTREFDKNGNPVQPADKRTPPADRVPPSERTPSTERGQERATERKSERPTIQVRAGESIQRALDGAPAGALIEVGPGVYKERLHIRKDGITLKSNGAVIDLDGRPISGGAIEINNRRGVTIDGFEIKNVRGNTPMAIHVQGASSDVSILNNNIHRVLSDTNAHGIGVFGNSGTPMRNIIIDGNQVYHLKLGQSESVVLNGNIEKFRITNNKIHDNDNIGIDIIGGEGVGRAGIDRARDGLIANNLVYNIDTTHNPTYRKPTAAGIYVDGGRDVEILNNTVRNSNYGIEIASERHGWDTEKIKVRGNRVEDSHIAGISLGGGSSSNGGVTDSVVENNILKNRRNIWQQHNVRRTVIRDK